MEQEQIPQNHETTQPKKCKNTGCIYAIIGHGKLCENYIRYVGKTIESPKCHLQDYVTASQRNTTSKRPLYVWLKESLKNRWTIEIITIAEMYERDLGTEERRYIKYFRTIYPDLLNQTDGTEGSSSGWKISEEARKKQSKIQKIIHSRPEYIEKLRKANEGNSPWNKGIPQSNETKMKISEIARKNAADPEIKKKQRIATIEAMRDPKIRAKISKAGANRKPSEKALEMWRQRLLNNHPTKKLSFNDITIIRLKFLLGHSIDELAKEFNLNDRYTRKITNKEVRILN